MAPTFRRSRRARKRSFSTHAPAPPQPPPPPVFRPVEAALGDRLARGSASPASDVPSASAASSGSEPHAGGTGDLREWLAEMRLGSDDDEDDREGRYSDADSAGGEDEEEARSVSYMSGGGSSLGGGQSGSLASVLRNIEGAKGAPVAGVAAADGAAAAVEKGVGRVEAPARERERIGDRVEEFGRRAWERERPEHERSQVVSGRVAQGGGRMRRLVRKIGKVVPSAAGIDVFIAPRASSHGHFAQHEDSSGQLGGSIEGWRLARGMTESSRLIGGAGKNPDRADLRRGGVGRGEGSDDARSRASSITPSNSDNDMRSVENMADAFGGARKEFHSFGGWGSLPFYNNAESSSFGSGFGSVGVAGDGYRRSTGRVSGDRDL